MPQTRRIQGTRKRSTTTRSRAAARATASSNGSILAWEDDPGQPPALRHPVSRPVPKPTATSLPIAIRGKKPAARPLDVGTPGFRYWANAEALSRAAQFWAATLPSGTKWFKSNGTQLPVQLDQDVDLNAYYDRNGLHFFHGTVNGTTVYSAESPDVACHELGHAVLDALKPQLWDAMSGEVAAFHESFGDMSAMLSALQLKSVRDEVLSETSGKLDRSSRLSRLAEQLGWAIRQAHPDARRQRLPPQCGEFVLLRRLDGLATFRACDTALVGAALFLPCLHWCISRGSGRDVPNPGQTR